MLSYKKQKNGVLKNGVHFEDFASDVIFGCNGRFGNTLFNFSILPFLTDAIAGVWTRVFHLNKLIKTQLVNFEKNRLIVRLKTSPCETNFNNVVELCSSFYFSLNGRHGRFWTRWCCLIIRVKGTKGKWKKMFTNAFCAS